MKKNIILIVLCCLLLMGATNDYRFYSASEPVARMEFATLDWVTGEGHAAQTASLNLNGTILRQDVIISSVTANPTVNVSVTNQNSVSLSELNHTNLTDGTNHTFDSISSKSSADADFNPVTVNDTVTVSVDPSADAGGSGQTLTVKVIYYMR